jgi:DNA repair exonuclease SbcCD nuclease subunit
VSDAEPRTLRIAHLADTHLGYVMFGKSDPVSGRNQRAIDIERSFEAAVSDILTRQVDLVLHAGDVFHHTRPSWSTLAHFVRQMRRLEIAGIPAVVIAGNHDTPRMRTTGSVYGLLALALPGTRFFTGYEAEEEPFPELDLRVHGVPHGALTNPDPPTPLPDPTCRNVLVTHGDAPGHDLWRGHEPGEVELRGNLLDSEFDYIALGHVHLRGSTGINAWYSGSTERTSWGDQQAQPGYALVTLGAKSKAPHVEYIDLPARPMITLEPIDAAERSATDLASMIVERAGALDQPEAMVRIELQHAPRPLFRETEAIVRRTIGEAVWHIRLTAPGEEIGGDNGQTSGLDDLQPLTLFKTFVEREEKSGRYDPPFASSFRERGSKAIEEAVLRLRESGPDESAA